MLIFTDNKRYFQNDLKKRSFRRYVDHCGQKTIYESDFKKTSFSRNVDIFVHMGKEQHLLKSTFS